MDHFFTQHPATLPKFIAAIGAELAEARYEASLQCVELDGVPRTRVPTCKKLWRKRQLSHLGDAA